MTRTNDTVATSTVPAERLRRYDQIRRDSSARELMRSAAQAERDVTALLAASEPAVAAGAVMEMMRALLVRATASADVDGVPPEEDLRRKEAMACQLEAYSMPVAAIMITAAVAYQRALAATPTEPGVH